MQTFGSTTYTWNVRGQLAAVTAGNASFSYDPLGRRTSASTNGATTQYLYDGLNPATIAGNLVLASDRIDEVFALISSSGTTSYLRDALGSTIAETNTSAATTASYYYSPYGDTTISGTSTLPMQFTGRDNDGPTGLSYYRARYYSPQFGRFIAEDPLGIAAGSNFYAYVNGDPIDLDDPFGLRPLTQCEKDVLAPYIGKRDLDNADLHDGEVPWWLGKNYIGVTIGNDIYFRAGVYDPSTPDGIALLGHELVHVDQYRAGMNIGKYVWSTRHGYENSPYEKSAYAEQAEILRNLMREHAAACTCTH